MQSIVVILLAALIERDEMELGDGVSALNFLQVTLQTSEWTADHVAGIASQTLPPIPLITLSQTQPVLPGYDLWDLWPVQLTDGKTADFDGWTVWMILSAPVLADPEERHKIARIRMMTEKQGVWRDCGNLYPDGHCPGSREWAGSVLYDPATGRLTSFHTAAGRRGEAPTYEQRIFQSSGVLSVTNGAAKVSDWSTPYESFQSGGAYYLRVTQTEGKPGHIKGFRDPAHFRDPADCADYILFTGSLAKSASNWNGVIGIAKSETGQYSDWHLLPPIVSADGLCNEQERPHIVFHGGLYYLFWSSHNKVFAPGGPSGPTALYGMVAQTVTGPYRPLNGTGLVAGNPAEEPFQTYSWWVMHDLQVASFIDLWGLSGRDLESEHALLRSNFGGTPAPLFRLVLDGDSAQIAAS